MDEKEIEPFLVLFRKMLRHIKNDDWDIAAEFITKLKDFDDSYIERACDTLTKSIRGEAKHG